MGTGLASHPTILNIKEIAKILPHRYPFLLIDRVIEMEPRQRIVAIKNVSINEPHFQGHFPDYPIMPGVLMVEAIAQAGGVALVQDPSEAFAKAMPSAALAACASAQSLSLSGLEMFLLDLGTSPP